MRRLIVLGVIVLLVVLAAPVVAQDEEAVLALGYQIKVTKGHEDAFEAGLKKQVQWYKDNAETWHWHAWEWMTGKNTGQFTFRTPGHKWADMDARKERAQRARAHFTKEVRPHIDSMQGSIGAAMPKLSLWPQEEGIVPIVSVYEFRIHYGMSQDFQNVIQKLHDAIVKAEYPLQYGWMTTVNGGEVPTYWLVVPHKSWSAMKGPEKPFWVMVEETVGRAEASALRKALVECVKEEHSGMARFRPELSYVPAEG